MIWDVGLDLSALLPCGNLSVYQKNGRTEISMLDPRYMQVLYPHPQVERPPPWRPCSSRHAGRRGEVAAKTDAPVGRYSLTAVPMADTASPATARELVQSS